MYIYDCMLHTFYQWLSELEMDEGERMSNASLRNKAIQGRTQRDFTHERKKEKEGDGIVTALKFSIGDAESLLE